MRLQFISESCLFFGFFWSAEDQGLDRPYKMACFQKPAWLSTCNNKMCSTTYVILDTFFEFWLKNVAKKQNNLNLFSCFFYNMWKKPTYSLLFKVIMKFTLKIVTAVILLAKFVKNSALIKKTCANLGRNIRATGSQFRFLTAPRVNSAINNFSRDFIFSSLFGAVIYKSVSHQRKQTSARAESLFPHMRAW